MLITIAVSGPVFTVMVEVALRVPEVAVMVAVPGGLEMVAAALTKPAVTIATEESEVVQEAPPVKFLVLPSSKVPVADICRVVPCTIEAEVGATANEVRVGFTKKPRQLAARESMKSAVNAAKSRSFG